MLVFSQKVPPILGVHFQSAGGCGGGGRPPARVSFKHPMPFCICGPRFPLFAGSGAACPCCVGATFFDASVKVEKKDYKDRIQDRAPIHRCSRSQHPVPLQVRRSGGRRRGGSACEGCGCVHVSDVVRGAWLASPSTSSMFVATSDVVFTARYAHPDVFCSQ